MFKSSCVVNLRRKKVLLVTKLFVAFVKPELKDVLGYFPAIRFKQAYRRRMNIFLLSGKAL